MSDAKENPQSEKRSRLSLRFSIRFILILIIFVSVYLAYAEHLKRQPKPLPTSWDFGTGRNIKWTVPLGSQSYSAPTIHQGKVFIGTNNGHGYDPALPSNIDLGVMLCFDAKDGKFLWQHSNFKLAVGRSEDWPLQGVYSQAYANGDRLWYVSNRCEVVCLDTEGFYDKQNDGVSTETNTRDQDADVVWKVDMRKRFGVHPHNASHCNVVVDHSRVYVNTSNGVGPSHVDLVNPKAPSFVVLDRLTGKTIWTDNTPKYIPHGAWGSPTLTTIAGKKQILFPGGDGWLYSFEPEGDGKGGSVLLWKFDCNEKTVTSPQSTEGIAKGLVGGLMTRNQLITAPTVYDDKVYVTLGQDPEHGIGPSHVWCISPANLRGDISPTTVRRGPGSRLIGPETDFQYCDPSKGDVEIANPNSGLVWKYTGVDSNSDGIIDESDTPVMNRSLGRVIIGNDRAYVTDLNGVLHCLDAKTGNYLWHFDTLSAFWNSPLVVNDQIYISDEDGAINVLDGDASLGTAAPKTIFKGDTPNYNSVYGTPLGADGVLYLVTRNQLIAIEQEK